MKIKFGLFTSLCILMLSGCLESDPAPKCTTKAITYQEFQTYQEKQNTTLTSDNKQVKARVTPWKVQKNHN